MDESMKIFIVFFLVSSALCETSVPVLIWSTHRSKDVNNPAVPALLHLNVANLQARYLDSFKPTNILLFEQDALSAEDLSSHAAELQHVNNYIKNSQSLYLPSVVEPMQLQHNLAQQGYKVTTLSAGIAISEVKLDKTGKNLVVVKLPPSLTNPSRSRALRKADEVIESVTSKIGHLADFTVIFTAHQSSADPVDSISARVEHTRIARSLQRFGDPDLPSNFHNGTCVMVYFRNNMQISLSGPDGTFVDVPENTASDTPVKVCDGDVQSIQLNYGDISIDGTEYSKLKIKFIFNRVVSSWRSPNTVLNFMTKKQREDRNISLQLVKWNDNTVPIGMSYSCSNTIIYREFGNGQFGDAVLRINGVQVQPFISNPIAKFGDYWDCVGFFSIGIWAAWFAGIICLIILSVGVAMLADIKTMDRFEDPKGKTIVIPQVSD